MTSEEIAAPFAAIVRQCLALNAAILAPDFDGFTRLDPTLNKAIGYIHAADETIALYPQGRFPLRMASLAVRESLRLLHRCRKRYGRRKTKEMEQAYHAHFRLWFYAGVPQLPERLYKKRLFESEEKLIAAICDHNANIVEPSRPNPSNPSNFSNPSNLSRSRSPRRKPLPRDTKWIKIEREAVLDFANDPKRNTEGKAPHELCHHVWQLNQIEFENAASLPVGQRGYKNSAALRTYFYRKNSTYQKSKYANTTQPLTGVAELPAAF